MRRVGAIAVVSILACVGGGLIVPASAQENRWSRLKTEQLNRLISQIEAATGAPSEEIATAQYMAALANEAAADAGTGDYRAVSLLRQFRSTGKFPRQSVKWIASATDGSRITCIASPATSQIVWQGNHSEMNPSINRWNDNCAASSPLAQKALFVTVALTKQRLHDALRDPEGTRYRDVRAMASGSRVSLCGEINMRNGFGGFTGYKRFIADGGAIVLPDSDLNEVVIARDWSAHCGSKDLGPVSLSD